MQVPKYIEETLVRRAHAAENWENYDRVITDFIVKNDINVSLEDYCGGMEGIVHPWESAERILACIRDKE